MSNKISISQCAFWRFSMIYASDTRWGMYKDKRTIALDAGHISVSFLLW